MYLVMAVSHLGDLYTLRERRSDAIRVTKHVIHYYSLSTG